MSPKPRHERDDENEEYEVVLDRKKSEPWHLSKNVPITLLLAIVIQTIGLVSWASTFRAEFVAFRESTDTRISAFSTKVDDRYRKSEALVQLQLRDERIARVAEKFQDVKSIVESLNLKLDSRFEKLERTINRLHEDVNSHNRRKEQ